MCIRIPRMRVLGLRLEECLEEIGCVLVFVMGVMSLHACVGGFVFSFYRLN